MNDDTKSKMQSQRLPQRPTQHPEQEFRPAPVIRRRGEEPTGPLTKATVAPGHVVHAPIPGERQVVGYDLDKREDVLAAVQVEHRPGAEITLPLSEVERLRRAGFLVDPAKAPPPPPDPNWPRRVTPESPRHVGPGVEVHSDNGRGDVTPGIIQSTRR